ncbi:uncharacterized protein HD556DRAFT_1440588 [Suillus plorans]|uniref:Methyltransferase domain-containing protein n=1 Tax=Suillus plorans TaxID=116603 RepID=A0A9P7IZH0_9AGAM|nr:uncharacterized protein HD556DRAFT_1440588 [Suillus plorans]KAG1798251.1 hypothetical protein HD556DRAFT_1440588 [Suillus plorans]
MSYSAENSLQSKLHGDDLTQAVAKSLYVLPTDEQERKRLAVQYEVLRHGFGGRVVFAPIELHAGDKVLDSGVGSATWLLDCYNANKDVNFHGIDLKTNIFPELDDIQKQRIHLGPGNILQLPNDWTSNFQLVNQRLLIAALSKEMWNTVVDEIFRVLAPGGWVQLLEASHCSAGEVTQRHFSMLQDLFVKRGLLLNCIEHIPNVLKSAGFDNITAQRLEISLGGGEDEDGMEAKARESFIGAYKGMQTPVVKMGIRTEGEYVKLMEDLEREWETNAQSKVVFYTFVAQKPTASA